VYYSPSMNRPYLALVLLVYLNGPIFGADFECRWAAAPPKIDGKLDDAAWKGAQEIEEFTSAWLPEGQR
jgi:hypothetical protein